MQEMGASGSLSYSGLLRRFKDAVEGGGEWGCTN
jgi:hypothetical protein